MDGEKRQPNEKNGIGGNDAELIARWPGLLYNKHPRLSNVGRAGHLGRVALGAMRTGLRVVNNVPLLKRRMIAAEHRFRGIDQTPQGH